MTFHWLSNVISLKFQEFFGDTSIMGLNTKPILYLFNLLLGLCRQISHNSGKNGLKMIVVVVVVCRQISYFATC